NVLFSPSTIASSYALIYATSQGQLKSEINNIIFANWTEQEIYDSTRRYTTSSKSKNFLGVEKIFYQQDTSPGPLPSRDLNQLISDVFNTTVDKVDFANNIDFSRSIINQWVSDKTRNKVRGLFSASDLKSDAVMVLASGAALDGTFTYGFCKHVQHSLKNSLLAIIDLVPTGLLSYLYAQNE
uniref:Serpin domain-containing protein n=1 Tax=Romanomermis culicivorax TaxID=13658 RepID=A0A915IBP8_ROMCU